MRTLGDLRRANPDFSRGALRALELDPSASGQNGYWTNSIPFDVLTDAVKLGDVVIISSDDQGRNPFIGWHEVVLRSDIDYSGSSQLQALTVQARINSEGPIGRLWNLHRDEKGFVFVRLYFYDEIEAIQFKLALAAGIEFTY